MKCNTKVLLMILAISLIMTAILIVDIEKKNLLDDEKTKIQYSQVLEMQRFEIRVQKLEEKQQEILRNQKEIIEAQITILEILAHTFALDMEITAYAPLDPGAVEGMCFLGDPNLTASGNPLIPGLTIAAGPGIPFGTRVWIESIGIREVHDRGGMITDSHIDVAVWTRKEAFEIGRSNRRVIILNNY